MFWGGGQEGGLRGGTQNAGLIVAFAEAARYTLAHPETFNRKVKELRDRLRQRLSDKGLLNPSPERTRAEGRIRWLSPETAISQITSISIPGIDRADMAQRLEEQGCLVATGSACASGAKQPDRILSALGFDEEVASCGIRISLSPSLEADDIDCLANAIENAIERERQGDSALLV
jgi:cysteine desulfurase